MDKKTATKRLVVWLQLYSEWVKLCVGMKNNHSVFTDTCVEYCMCVSEFIWTLDSI